ncbi:DNA cytosine methyltransferase [Erysipelotrichaceae bacterium OH741_COT-311]|nr:DNA cytosine methyltransferase [Erysipelotrichaceae bacterium OH741_COT-311]
MRGGLREGAGRKSIPNSDKKKGRNVYLSEDQIEEIMQLNIEGANTFSQKCVELIGAGLEQLKANAAENMKPIERRAKNEKVFENNTDKLTFIDLFAGIGGIRKGFEDANTKCVFSSEWDKYAAKTYEANYGEVPFGDITKIDEKDIPDHDVLLAGFPCQPFSNIGKRQGFAHETQGTLFFDVLRILKKKMPKMFLLENVKGLLTNDGGRTFKVILDNLNHLDYSIFYKVLDAQDFGLPQRRERIVIVGFRKDLGIEKFSFPEGDRNHRIPVNSILEHNPKGYSISKHLQESYLFKKDDGRPQLIGFDSETQVNTLCASYHKIQRLTGTFVKDGDTGVRLFSELELKRLMGFPDDFIIPVSRTQMYRQFGNSVAVPMMKEVADAMKNAISNIRKTV